MTAYKLEKPAQELAEAFSKFPALNEIPIADARGALDGGEEAPIPMPEVDESWVTVRSEFGEVQVRLVRPIGAVGPLPVVVYLHGGGWIFGSPASHDRLTRELAIGANAVLAVVDYARAPEAKYPVQLEQCYATARWIYERGEADDFDTRRLAVAGDSAGGNMSTVLAIMAKQRGDVSFVHQSLYYPMTDADPDDTESLRLFKDGPYGTKEVMEWFWSSYLPDEKLRGEVTVSPLRASSTDLEELPPALVIVDENDILRDQGEAYADKLREAGVPTTSVRFNGTMHDFMMLNALRDTESTRAAVSLAVSALRRAFGTSESVP
jgi:acetyl esterase